MSGTFSFETKLNRITVPTADCKNAVSFFKNGMASYNFGMVDTIKSLHDR
jgi:hypothetical protein